MQITPLASGSQGNSLFLRAAGECVLVDIGLPIEDLEDRLTQIEVSPQQITAVCVTHRHKDHIRGVAPFCRKYKVPVFGSRRTLRSLCNKLTRATNIMPPDQPLRIGELHARAIEVSHDAPHTVAFRFDDGKHSLGIATDLGCTDETLRHAFDGLDALFLEFNYDPDLLAASPYSTQLRSRIAADTGHLSNQQAASFLIQLDQQRLRCLWLAHVSQRSNTADRAMAAARTGLARSFDGVVEVACQDQPSTTFDLCSTTTRTDRSPCAAVQLDQRP